MSAKNYVMALSASLFVFIAANVIFWNTVTRGLFNGRDLGRLGSFVASESEIGTMIYPKHHTKFADYIKSGMKESFDVITIGDSFSNGGGGSYYQDYLASEYGLKVLNIGLSLGRLYTLIESGMLDEISPSAVIFESVERGLQERFGCNIIIPDLARRDDIIRAALANKGSNSAGDGYLAPVMAKANLQYLYNKLYHMFHPERLSPKVYITELDRPMFTNKNQENILLHYYEDLNFIASPLNAAMMNENMNKAADILSKKGITLIFFAAPDKYDLYYPYIKDKAGRPENPSFSKIRNEQGKNYVFIDALAILREKLAEGVKDIYSINDTHWSYVGIKYFCDELVKYLSPPKLK